MLASGNRGCRACAVWLRVAEGCGALYWLSLAYAAQRGWADCQRRVCSKLLVPLQLAPSTSLPQPRSHSNTPFLLLRAASSPILRSAAAPLGASWLHAEPCSCTSSLACLVCSLRGSSEQAVPSASQLSPRRAAHLHIAAGCSAAVPQPEAGAALMAMMGSQSVPSSLILFDKVPDCDLCG